MGWFGNLKMSVKMIVGFGLVIMLVIGLAVVSVVNIIDVDDKYDYVISYPNEREIIILHLQKAAISLRFSAAAMSALADGNEPAIIENYIRLSGIEFADCNDYIQEFVNNLNNDLREANENKNYMLRHINDIKTSLANYMSQCVVPVSISAREGDHDKTIGYLLDSVNSMNEMMSKIEELRNIAEKSAEEWSESAKKSADATTLLVTVIAIIIVLLSLTLAFFISSIISKPIKRLADVAENVAKGTLNVNIDTSSTDEIGTLAKSFSMVVKNVNTMITDIEKLHANHEDGQINDRIDENLYAGAYKEVATGVNEMIQSYVSMIKDILNTLTKFAAGDFTARLQPYKGDKRVANDQVAKFRTTIEEIIKEINVVAKAGTDGNLSFRANADKYSGDWQMIMVGLNDVLDSVINPIAEVKDVLRHISIGEFNTQVTGTYKGDFADMKIGMNNTVTSIDGYINEITETLAAIADGDLRVSISREYIGNFNAIKSSINSIADSLNKTMSEISSASEQVLAGAKQISASAMQLAEGASEQASSLEELSASVETINNQTIQNAENAATADALSERSTKNAIAGNDEMRSMLDAMNGIKDSSSNISKIIKIISDIAFQTNLLALNASVEAARVGDHGRGFAVVAGEVRDLANKSQGSADDSAMRIEESNNRVQEGMRIAENTAESLNTIVENVTQISNIIKTIADASKNQSEAISQVSIGLSQISQVVQTNSSTSEESAAAAEELNSQAELLKQMVSYFKV
ncbi:MAG: methyl-accepting chemotaxis protein [Defluviitaleaceae bacterium]|nr:methyl-accepting chemotaxis protein [Defluviitaleaceae bacterium]